MLDTFITSFRLKNTYRTNTIIYSIRCLPIIGKLLPASLYGSGGLKTFANVISVLWEIARHLYRQDTLHAADDNADARRL